MDKIEQKRENEKKIVTEMIYFYCHHKHKTTSGQLCSHCANLLKYAINKCDHCPFMANKTFCSNCKVHCYSETMRMAIKQVMRYSGPRMIIRHPIMVIKHIYYSIKEKTKINKD